MKTVGITGGIGSGKSTVCKVFETLAIPVFYADDEVKKMYQNDAELISQVGNLLGNEVFDNGKLQTRRVSEVVFHDRAKLDALNKIVHPLAAKRFREWRELQQDAPYVIKEAAILIESGAHRDCDFIILVTAPEATRIKRVQERDKVSESDIRERMSKQWTDDQKRPYCQIELVNDGTTLLLPAILQFHDRLTK